MTVQELLTAPDSREVEERILGILLAYPDEGDLAYAELKPGDFAHPELRTIFTALQATTDRSIVAVQVALEHQGQLAAVGGRGYLAQLQADALGLGDLAKVVKLVQQLVGWRRYTTALGQAVDRYGQRPGDLAQEVGTTQQALTDVLAGHSGDGIQSLGEMLADGRFARLMAWATNPVGSSRAIPTGLPSLDQHLYGGGLMPGKLYTIGGATSMGKSSVLRWILGAIAQGGHRVMLFSVEQDRDEVIEELAFAGAGINPSQHNTDGLSPREMSRFVQALEVMRDMPFHVDDEPAITPNKIAAKLIGLKARYPDLAVVGIDYLHILDHDNPRALAGTEQTINEITKRIRDTCKKLGLACILASQLTKDVTNKQRNPTLKPALEHFRGSGAVTYLSYAVLGLFRPDYYVNQGMLDPDPSLVRLEHGVEVFTASNDLDLIILKQQRGVQGVSARLKFYPDTRTITDPLDRELTKRHEGWRASLNGTAALATGR